jgi:predicted amidohydrolase
MPGPETRALFEAAAQARIGFQLGFAELVAQGGRTRRFNSAILVDRDGRIAGRYRKIHLPGHAEHEPWRAFQHLEKRYFEVGDLGWGVWRVMGANMGMAICNDRRWPETYRVMGLQDVEMVFIGYNTPRPTMTGSASSTTSLSCRPAPTRTRPGSSASPSAASRRAAR